FAFKVDADGTRRVVEVSFRPRPAGGSFVQLRSVAYDLAPTALGDRAQQRQTPLLSDVLPRLEPPVGDFQATRGGGGGTDNYDSEAELISEYAISDLMTHYGRQMEAAGWTAVGENVTADFATSAWTKNHDVGPVAASLLIRSVEEAEYRLRAMVVTVDDR
ncbi:MAG: hypothetical protein AAGK21_11795, partial [Bacteroidota bacterium]